MIPVFPSLGQQCQHQREQLNFSHLSSESCSITKKEQQRTGEKYWHLIIQQSTVKVSD